MREKWKESRGRAENTTGLRREKGGGGRAARSAHRAKCSAAKAPALTLLRTPCASGPGGPSVRRRKQGTDRGPETIRVHLYNAVSFILPRLVICPANEQILRDCLENWTELLIQDALIKRVKIFVEYLQRISLYLSRNVRYDL